MDSNTGGQISNQEVDIFSKEVIERLKASIRGQVIIKEEAPEDIYRAAIDRYNKATFKKASTIVFCESDTDVAACLKYAQDWKLDFAIACGRHSYSGASSTKGLVIDLGKMKRITIDKGSMTVKAQGGCKAVDLEAPLQAEGLSVVMGLANDTDKFNTSCFPVCRDLTFPGIGGITLGGGSGLLTGQYGLIIDNLLAAKVVVANGDVLVCSEKENPDLFWAIRGGGSNFGVVTEFTYRIHQQGNVFHGPLIFTPEKTRSVLETADFLQQSTEKSDGKLNVILVFTKLPNMPKVHPITLIFYDGPEEEALELTKPLWDLHPVASMVSVQPYAEVTKPSEMVDGPLTHRSFSSSNALLHTPLDVNVAETLIGDFDVFMNKYGAAVSPSRALIEIRSYKKSASISPLATALAARRPAMVVVVEAQFDSTVPPSLMREETKNMIGKVRESVRQRRLSGSEFANTNLSNGIENVEDIFGENLPRLRRIKKKYDPGFIFNKWYPIAPENDS